MRPPNYREQRTGAYDDGLHMGREGGRARADRRAPRQTNTATPRTQSCKFGSVRDALWEWKPVQHIPHRVGYVVKLPEPANKSSRSPLDPPQLLHPNPRYRL